MRVDGVGREEAWLMGVATTEGREDGHGGLDGSSLGLG